MPLILAYQLKDLQLFCQEVASAEAGVIETRESLLVIFH